MRFFIIISFLFCLGLEFLQQSKYRLNKPSRLLIGALIVISLIIAASLRDGFRYHDYPNYVNYYWTRQGNVEFTFNLIADISKWIDYGNYYILFVIYAILGVITKYNGISRLTPFIFSSLALYIAHYYSLHELTQIRAGVASGIGLIAIEEIYNRNFWKYILLVGLATCFHTSAVIYLPLYFLKTDSFNKTKWFLGSLGVIIIIKGVMERLFSYIFSYAGFLTRGGTLQGYVNNGIVGTDRLEIVSKFYLMAYILCLIYIFFSERIYRCDSRFYLLLKIYIMSIVIRIIFAKSIPMVALRGSELLDVVFIVLYPMITYIIKPKSVGVLIVGLIGLCYIYHMFSWGIIP